MTKVNGGRSRSVTITLAVASLQRFGGEGSMPPQLRWLGYSPDTDKFPFAVVCKRLKYGRSLSPSRQKPLARSRARCPEGSEAEARSDGKGGYLVTLPHDVLNRLKAIRGPGESYCDVIIRIARG
jgi:hypothetical protein